MAGDGFTSCDRNLLMSGVREFIFNTTSSEQTRSHEMVLLGCKWQKYFTMFVAHIILELGVAIVRA